jgi:hypothetical protein
LNNNTASTIMTFSQSLDICGKLKIEMKSFKYNFLQANSKIQLEKKLNRTDPDSPFRK